MFNNSNKNKNNNNSNSNNNRKINTIINKIKEQKNKLDKFRDYWNVLMMIKNDIYIYICIYRQILLYFIIIIIISTIIIISIYN